MQCIMLIYPKIWRNRSEIVKVGGGKQMCPSVNIGSDCKFLYCANILWCLAPSQPSHCFYFSSTISNPLSIVPFVPPFPLSVQFDYQTMMGLFF